MTDIIIGAGFFALLMMVVLIAAIYSRSRPQTEVTVYDPATGNPMIEVRASSTTAVLRLLDKVH